MQCERVNTSSEGSKMDGFLKLNMMKVPDFANWSHYLEADCRQQCLENCYCIAYAYDTGIGCMSWTGSLIDAQKFSSAGVDLYVRLAYSDLGEFFFFPLQPNPHNTSAPQANEILVKYNLLDQKREEKKTYLVYYFV